MLIPPKYFLTANISRLLQTIEANKEVIEAIQIPAEIERNIRRRSSLKSSLYSARIEGNPLTLDELSSSKDQKRAEIFNILKALNIAHERGARNLTLGFILNMHKTVMERLIDKKDQGRTRTETTAIYNAAGIAIYLPPPARQILPLLKKLIKFANSDKEPFIPVRAALAHYTFEKIHPFLDGNGRVGRLLIQAVMEKGGYSMKGLLNFEEYLENHKPSYYRALENSERDTTVYVEFMLEGIEEAAKKARQEILSKRVFTIEDTLLPRRAEILNIIKDHKLINFNTIKRRFRKVNDRTLRYDIKKLADSGLITKLGSTKGVWYKPSIKIL